MVLKRKKIIFNRNKMENFLESLQLMVIGMATVFSVLLLVIFLGNLLIKAINRFAPEEVATKVTNQRDNAAIDPTVAQAIQLAIAQITNGKGKVEKIEKK